MENKELYREKIESKIVKMELGEETLTFEKEDGSKISLSYYHSQDCCEAVYADFSSAKYYQESIVGKEFKELVIKGVAGMGFLICLFQDWERGEKIFIPCYNEQNGYYSSGLELVINEKVNRYKRFSRRPYRLI